MIFSPPIFTKRSQQAIAPDPDNRLAANTNPYSIPLDPIEFVRTCRIRTGADFELFDPYSYQIELGKIIDRAQQILIIKDRQLGITEFLAARALHRALIDPAYVGAFISIGQDKSSDIRDRCKSMPNVAGLEWAKNSGKALTAKESGSILFLPSTDNAARGLPSVTELVFDEAGFPRNFNELYGAGTAAQEMVPAEVRKTIICTTIPPDGQANPVWGMFAAENDRSALEAIKLARAGGTNCDVPGMVWWIDRKGWAKVAISHTAHPIYGSEPDYLTSVCDRRRIPLAIAKREHDLGIEATGSSLFCAEAIERAKVGAWAEPIAGRKYFAAIDPNFGGHDRFICLILDYTDPIASIVAEYAEADRSIEYAEGKCLDLFARYNVTGYAIESNSGGAIVAEDFNKKVPHLKGVAISTSHSNKIQNTDRVALAIEQGNLIYPPDWQGVKEFQSFSSQYREAAAGEYDDRVMALAVGFACIETFRKVRSPSLGAGSVRR